MNHLLILYNPYYNENTIENHLTILKERAVVAFGKVKSKNRDYDSTYEEKLKNIYSGVSKETPLQLFLTDYNSIFVAHVINVTENKTKIIKAPEYYDALEVEQWFIIDDLRLLVHNDFKTIRDTVLTNFLATNYNNRTYALYGNRYTYPMQVTMKEEINYFEKMDENFKYYTEIFKSKQQLQIQQNLIDFTFGADIFYKFLANTQDNIINAELEYQNNKDNPLYDSSSIVVKYSKALELELHRFMKSLFRYLMEKDTSLQNFPYSIQGRNYMLSDIMQKKANYGTYKFLIKSYQIKDAISRYISHNNLRYFISTTIPQFINIIQTIRNESVHGASTTLQECKEIRNSILGIGQSSFLGDLIVNNIDR